MVAYQFASVVVVNTAGSTELPVPPSRSYATPEEPSVPEVVDQAALVAIVKFVGADTPSFWSIVPKMATRASPEVVERDGGLGSAAVPCAGVPYEVTPSVMSTPENTATIQPVVPFVTELAVHVPTLPLVMSVEVMTL